MPVYYEDVEVGDVETHGDYEVTREEVLSFAERYDPQWFHTDPDRAAEESPYGGLIASGWHTAAMTMRLLVEGTLAEAATVGAKGVDELRWPTPVRPGDTLRIENEVLEKVPERPERGVIRARTRTYNGDDEAVFSMIGNVMYLRRGDD
ncbi:MaoC family dehydratase [Halobaculum roseum]|uniref:MaoC family dehydratase n=1 Tax=Halobaculum roseum TaxID=2175149 RepID=A0ABD5MI23_9EURY|nr:MaoC family dehydratase [Halobaculum roseum]QZY03071.1 MaoC family dehydratase [Halobaculum roseum]